MIDAVEAHAKLDRKLSQIGFPPIEGLIGRKFIFAFGNEVEWPNVVAGTIVGVSFENIESEEECFDFYVSIPQTLCRKIEMISRVSEGWQAFFEINKAQRARGGRETLYGDFQLL